MLMLEKSGPTIEQLERTVLSSIKTLSDARELLQCHISHLDFEVYPEVAEFVLTYHRQFYGKSLAAENFRIRFPEFTYSPIDDKKYIIELFRKEILTRRIRTILYTTNSSFLEMDPDEAASYLLKNTRYLIMDNTSSNRNITDGESLTRLEEYRERKELSKQSASAISSPWYDAMYHWMPGMLGIIWGKFGTGKSFFAMDLAIRTAYLKGRKVVFISPEMPRSEAEFRFDSLLGRYKGYTFDSAALIMGKDIDEEQYQYYLNNIKNKNLWITYENSKRAFSVMDIEAIIEIEEPWMVVIDGIRLMRDDTTYKSQDWQQLMNIIYGLKNVATTKRIVILSVAQANRDEEIGYSQGIAEASDKMIYLSTDPHSIRNGRVIPDNTREPVENVLHVTVNKNRSTGKLIRKSVEVKFEPAIGIVGDLLNAANETITSNTHINTDNVEAYNELVNVGHGLLVDIDKLLEN